MTQRQSKPSMPLFGGPKPTMEPSKPAREPAEPTARESPKDAAQTAPDGVATPVPIRLYPRQIDRLDVLRQTLARGVKLSRSAAIRFLIDHWTQ